MIKLPTKISNKRKSGFSIAEAMIVMLIVSISISAMAPMMSKRNRAVNSNGTAWMFTRNRTDMTSPNSKIGIGVPVNDDHPEAMLDVRVSNDSDNFISLKKGNNVIFSISNEGEIRIGTRANAINATIKTDGSAAFTGLTINRTDDDRAFTISKNGTEVAFMNANGVSQGFIPSGMLAFFDTSDCTTIQGGWEEVNADWYGRYPRIAGTYNILEKDGTTTKVSNVSLTNGQMYEDAIRDIVGTLGISEEHSYRLFSANIKNFAETSALYATTKAGNIAQKSDSTYSNLISDLNFQASRSVPTADENRVKTVGLRMCRKI